MLENKAFTIAKETVKLLRVNVVRVMIFTNSVSCVHLSPVNDPFVRMSATYLMREATCAGYQTLDRYKRSWQKRKLLAEWLHRSEIRTEASRNSITGEEG